MTTITGVPPPAVHDEFCYLLQADTFTHGRLTNPPHPLWKSFETFFVIQRPTYQAKYPPGQGLSLALGELIGGQPIEGAWLSTAAAAACICWMLTIWLDRRWGFVGGLLVALHPLLLQWSQCYWGGSLACAGGALLFGGVRAAVATRNARHAAMMGVGASILLLTRPYEGGLLILFAAGIALAKMASGARAGLPLRRWTRALVGFGVPCILSIGWLGYYNERVTGSAVTMPYKVYEQRYDPVPLLLFLPLQPIPHYNNDEMRDAVLNGGIAQYRSQTASVAAFLTSAAKKLALLQRYALMSFNIHYYTIPPYRLGAVETGLQFLLVIPLLGLPLVLERDPWMKLALMGCGLTVLAILTETWIYPHYVAAGGALLAALLVTCVRMVRRWEIKGRPLGIGLSRAVVVLYIMSFVVCAQQFYQARFDDVWPYERIAVVNHLKSQGGRSIVFVYYRPNHDPRHEWIYNAADIDSSPVVWARSLGPDQDARVLEYYRGRPSWRLDADSHPPVLTR